MSEVACNEPEEKPRSPPDGSTRVVGAKDDEVNVQVVAEQGSTPLENGDITLNTVDSTFDKKGQLLGVLKNGVDLQKHESSRTLENGVVASEPLSERSIQKAVVNSLEDSRHTQPIHMPTDVSKRDCDECKTEDKCRHLLSEQGDSHNQGDCQNIDRPIANGEICCETVSEQNNHLCKFFEALRIETNDVTHPNISFVGYESEAQMPEIMALITQDLSEPYSVYTYRYFLHNWPNLSHLAYHNSQCIGAVVCKLDLHQKNVWRGYIAMLVIHKDFRKNKIGSKLVKLAIRKMIEQGCDEVVLETEVTNKAALGLYENLGFVRDKRLLRYYLNGVDAWRLKLWLR